MTWSHCSGGSSWSGPEKPPIPALLTRISARPQACCTCPAKASRSGSEVTSQTTGSQAPPDWRICSAADSSAWRVRPAMTVVAPSSASLRAMAAPMPRPPPVTTATCPCKCASRFGRRVCHVDDDNSTPADAKPASVGDPGATPATAKTAVAWDPGFRLSHGKKAGSLRMTLDRLL